MENKQNYKQVKQVQKLLYRAETKDLKKTIPYLKVNWGKQRDTKDRKTNFIYKAEGFDDLLYEHSKNPFDDLNYAVRRYYNHVISNIVENIFCSYNVCKREEDISHKTIDLYIHNQPFDIKVSSYPARFNYRRENFNSDREYRNQLILWLYKNQSREGRYHESNRLFILCKNGDGKSSFKNNLLKMEFRDIHSKIESYLKFVTKNLNEGRPIFNQVTLPNNNTVCSDVILIDKKQ